METVGVPATTPTNATVPSPAASTSSPMSRRRSTPRCPGNQFCAGGSYGRSTPLAYDAPVVGSTHASSKGTNNSQHFLMALILVCNSGKGLGEHRQALRSCGELGLVVYASPKNCGQSACRFDKRGSSV